jgi:hypothetical protein
MLNELKTGLHNLGFEALMESDTFLGLGKNEVIFNAGRVEIGCEDMSWTKLAQNKGQRQF